MNYKIIAQDSKYVYLAPEKDKCIKGHYPNFYPYALCINKKTKETKETKETKNIAIEDFCNAVEKINKNIIERRWEYDRKYYMFCC